MGGTKLARILYLNVHDASYPRNKGIREFLVSAGHQVDMVMRRDQESFLKQNIDLIKRSFATAERYDVVVLSELSVQFALAAKLVAFAKRAILVVDSFVGMYETNVGDWQRVASTSPKGRAYAAFDRIAAVVARIQLIDTAVRAKALENRSRGQVISIPVSVPDWAVPQIQRPEMRNKFLYYGNYIRLHGLDYVVDAIKLLGEDTNAEFTFLGDGEDRPRIESRIKSEGLERRVTFLNPVREEELAGVIGDHLAVFGIFGTSPKAASVIANKVWQGLACSRTVITRSSAALEEIRPIVGAHLVDVDPLDPRDLAGAISEIVRHPPAMFPDGTTEALVGCAQRGMAHFEAAITNG